MSKINPINPQGSLLAGFMPLTLTTVASALLLISLGLPLWQMRLEAPQYKDEEALRVRVYPNELRGDLKELAVLNQYIGVQLPTTLPQLKWLPGVLVAGAIAGGILGFIRARVRRVGLLLAMTLLTVALAFAAAQALQQMHRIGHQRDAKTILVGVKDFTPPFLGTRRIAQFAVSSQFGIGAWLIGTALILQGGAAWMSLSVPVSSRGRKESVTQDKPCLALATGS